MMADSNCAFDLMSATFAKGLRVNEMTIVQAISVLKKLKELMDRTYSDFHLYIGIQVTASLLASWKDKTMSYLKTIGLLLPDADPSEHNKE